VQRLNHPLAGPPWHSKRYLSEKEAGMRSIRNTIRLSCFFFYSILLFLLLGCAAAFFHGGTEVPENYKVPKVIVSYRAEGDVPERVNYFLIRTDDDVTMFERHEDGSGSLFQIHWQVDHCDHFAAWVSPPIGIVSSRGLGGPAWEFVVPFDRSKEAKRFFYPKGTYRVEEIGAILRPVPNDPNTEPVARLIPK
jgi:hypothetical protein